MSDAEFHNPTEQEMMARGREIFESCYNGVVPPPEQGDPRGFSGMTLKMFNDFWGSPALPMREKRLLILGVIAGMGADPNLFDIHAKSALRNGEITVADLRAIILMVLPYVGYPRGAPLFVASEKLIAAHIAAPAE